MSIGRSLNPKRVRNALVCGIAAGVTVAVLAVFLFFVAGRADHHAALSYNSLNYEVTVRPNGDLRVVEHVDIKLDKKNGHQLWHQMTQRLTISDRQLSAITDVSVKDATSGKAYAGGHVVDRNEVGDDSSWDKHFAEQWYATVIGASVDHSGTVYRPASMTDEQYVQGLKDDPTLASNAADGDEVELAWNIPATEKAQSLKFDIGMTLKDVVSVYDDVAYFKWEPVGDGNTVPIGAFKATVTLPKGVAKDGGKTRHWLHYKGIGRIGAVKNGMFTFTVDDVAVKQHVDLVTIFDARVMDATVAHRKHGNYGDTVIANEQCERNEAQRRSTDHTRLFVWLTVALMLVMLVTGLAAVIYTNRRSSYRGRLEYFRDVPQISPAGAAMLNGVAQGNASLKGSAVSEGGVAATVLSLADKGFIALYPGSARWYQGLDMAKASGAQIDTCIQANRNDRDRATSTVVILPKTDGYLDNPAGELYPSEFAMLRFLAAASDFMGSRAFDLDSLSGRTGGGEWDEGPNLYDEYNLQARLEYDARGFTVSRNGLYASILVLLSMMGGVCLLLLLDAGRHVPVLASLMIGIVVLLLVPVAMLLQRQTFTASGDQMADELQGLANYLEDFSDFTDRDAFDVELWGHYLVYATALGISEKVVRRLAAASPQGLDGTRIPDGSAISSIYWTYYAPMYVYGDATYAGFGLGPGGVNFSDIGAQLSSEIINIGTPAYESSDAGGIGSGISFGGSGGGAGGGSFGGW